jgi:hypothetical protein
VARAQPAAHEETAGTSTAPEEAQAQPAGTVHVVYLVSRRTNIFRKQQIYVYIGSKHFLDSISGGMQYDAWSVLIFANNE